MCRRWRQTKVSSCHLRDQMVAKTPVVIAGAVDVAVVNWYEAEAEAKPVLSFTCTVKVADPAVVGVPLRMPAEDRVKPGGGVPLEADQFV